MLKISPLQDETQKEFCKLFEDYYMELGCDEDIPHLLKEYILPDIIAGLVKADILCENGEYVGFILYQTDDIENEWNLKEGWGNIRELYVTPSHRLQGLGKFLLYTAEMKLHESNTAKSYCLPTVDSEKFFLKCGYTDTGVYNADMDCNVFEKHNLINADCHK